MVLVEVIDFILRSSEGCLRLTVRCLRVAVLGVSKFGLEGDLETVSKQSNCQGVQVLLTTIVDAGRK